ncbi:MAG: TetR/AcrR family transcriptional regulator [Pseudomonadota bacterium]
MTRERGRPRSFDPELALDQALQVFWKHGFQGASLQELTLAMGLSKPSLYAAFGDKEGLYLKALERYVRLLVERHAACLEEPQVRCAVERFLRSLAAMLVDPGLPGGCFIINGTADCGGAYTPEAVEQALRLALQGCEGLLLTRLQRALDEGQLPKATEVDSLAALFGSLIAGLAVLAKSGTPAAKLDRVIAAAMVLWPSNPG